MLNLQKLRYLSCICAYCNKVIPLYERTNDHLIPRCAGGETEIQNIENAMSRDLSLMKTTNSILYYLAVITTIASLIMYMKAFCIHGYLKKEKSE